MNYKEPQEISLLYKGELNAQKSDKSILKMQILYSYEHNCISNIAMLSNKKHFLKIIFDLSNRGYYSEFGHNAFYVFLAKNNHTPSYILEELSNIDNIAIREAVALNSNTSQKTLFKLIADKETDVMLSALYNRNSGKFIKILFTAISTYSFANLAASEFFSHIKKKLKNEQI